MNTALLTNLKQNLASGLPGQSVQYQMAHTVRKTYPKAPKDARKAGVLILLYQKEGAWFFPIIQRVSTNKQDRHRGQISFPGGQYEPADQNLIHTAKREAEEEIGIEANDINILGSLTELYIPVSNFLVYPIVGMIDYKPEFTPQESEVHKIIEASIDQLLNPSTIQTTHMRMSENIILKDVPFYNIKGHVVWGATAMILAEFVALINN